VPPRQHRPGAASGGPSGPGRSGGTTRKRRLIIVSGAVFGAVLIAGVAVASLSSSGSPRTPNAQSTTLAGSNKCVVSYAVWSEANNKFKAAVTIANRDTAAVKDWKLWFLMPGDQVVSGNGKLKLDQQGRGVTVQSKTVLSPQETQTLQFTGRYKDSNAAPMVFELGGQACQTFVSPAPGAPSQPVEVLDNGTVRLGPVPSGNTPIPGISINPGGVAVPVPVTTTPPAGGVQPTTTTAPVVIDPPGGGPGPGPGAGDGDGDGVEGEGEGEPVEPSPKAPTTPAAATATETTPVETTPPAPTMPVATTEAADVDGEDDPE
jgi:serine/threonine-protein kinase